MGWGEKIFRYCERGQDPGFWAEPFNALSNAGFLIAAVLLWRRLSQSRLARMRQRSGIDPAVGRHRRECNLLKALIALVSCIGIGSFLFHTFATRWSRTADVAPIGIFMVLYLGMALRTFVGWDARTTMLAVAGFLGLTAAAATLACPAGLRSVTDFAREPCLKGTMGYVPALAALVLTGAMVRQSPEAGRRLLFASGLFAAAMVLRWLDRDLCAATWLLGQVRGTHALWHLLNAGTVYVLVAAAIDATAGRSGGDPQRPGH